MTKSSGVPGVIDAYGGCPLAAGSGNILVAEIPETSKNRRVMCHNTNSKMVAQTTKKCATLALQRVYNHTHTHRHTHVGLALS